ncbi:MAG: (E)-4-hydroxy-3-methylbut-2-enyl-diphosphate synthase [Candidatus Marinimicrobia bacterium]|nr:(E)-4-hydroxy-3-methylbut-2-enyl-diphosphate synthase [Candidatus Neomarinimicrobiota bacterium]
MTAYFESNLELLTRYQRYRTREVSIGNIPLGGNNPIRIQSMTNTDTMDTAGTVEQSIRLVDAGCDYVRITAPSVKESENLAVIKSELEQRGYSVPLIADIHFVPRAAEVAARIVEKVRINPGNYADRKKFLQLEYSPSDYQAELDRIRKRFTPLVHLCKNEGTAMRIGSNHGSLSDRILSHYGDTPLGMVESAMEFIRICADENFHDLIVSMKASNTRVMIQAYRLLVEMMEQEGYNYPLHLGVTEAGDGEDARIKSSLGIGSLLRDGLGDTVRVSLTEAPEAEIPVAKRIVQGIEKIVSHEPIPTLANLPINLFEYQRRPTNGCLQIGGDHVPVVILGLSHQGSASFDMNAALFSGDRTPDILYLGRSEQDPTRFGSRFCLYDSSTWKQFEDAPNALPLFDLEAYQNTSHKHPVANFVVVPADADVSALPDDTSIIWVLSSINDNQQAARRRFILDLMNHEMQQPVILFKDYGPLPLDRLLIAASGELGGLFNDGLADGIWLRSETNGLSEVKNVSFGILQASRTRVTKTEYIACPSCGRTLFDLEEVTAQIRDRTSHLKGVKIGIMGCIVNGPGEMADADFGYVGTGPGKISLYRGQIVVRPNIPQSQAVDELIALIKNEGYWVEPQ